MATPSASGELRDFNVGALVDQQIDYMLLGGHFCPAQNINFARQALILSVTGANKFSLSIPSGSFKKTGSQGYFARVVRGASKVDILLKPLSSGHWTYCVAIEGFVPGATLVRVSLRIGAQVGRTAIKLYRFSTSARTASGIFLTTGQWGGRPRLRS
jgi:hypothetical protein